MSEGINRRDFLRLGITYGALLSIGCPSLPKEKSETRPATDWIEPIIWGKKLEYNPFPYRSGKRHSSLEAGLWDMHKIIYTVKEEEAWLYVPQERAFVEVGEVSGFYEDDHMIVSGAFLDLDYIQKFVSANPHLNKIQTWHIHPNHVQELMRLREAAEMAESGVTLDERAVNFVDYKARVHCGVPSLIDTAAMISRTITFFKGVEYAEGVRSTTGAMTYSLTDEGREFYKEFDEKALLREVQDIYKSSFNSIEMYAYIRKHFNRPFAEDLSVEKIAEGALGLASVSMTNDHLRFHFYPLEREFTTVPSCYRRR